MKKCGYTGCNNEIQTWQQYCAEHYKMIMQGQGQVSEPPTIPPSKMQGVSGQRNVPTPTNPNTKFQQPQEDADNMSERERLIIKQTCLKCAVDLISKADYLEPPKEFNELVGEIETLTLKFFRLIVDKNENKY